MPTGTTLAGGEAFAPPPIGMVWLFHKSLC